MTTKASHEDQPSKSGLSLERSDVLFFIDNGPVAQAAIHHAQKVASAFHGKVVVVQVLCKPTNLSGPIDPVDWSIKKQQTVNRLELLTKRAKDAAHPCSIELLEGQCIGQIKAFMEHRQGDIAASPRSRSDMGWHSSETAWGVLMSKSAAVLMIPDDAIIEPNTPYRRILVPLDGSSRAEAALPKAIFLARAESAELMLCYVAPDPGLTAFGAKDQEAERLHVLVKKRNEQAGKTYLAQIRKKLEQNGLKIAVRLSSDGDARRALIKIVSQEAVDFVVMATHGQSGHNDVPTGDVARFILDKADVPVLLLRYRNGREKNHSFGKVVSTGIRLPVGTD